MRLIDNWWYRRKEELKSLVGKDCPLFVYNEETLNDTLFDLLALDSIDALFYPVHANSHPRILRKVFELGGGFKCISPNELTRIIELFPEIEPRKILFMPDHASGEDFEYAFHHGAHVIVKNAQTLKTCQEIFQNKEISVWIDSAGEQGGNVESILKSLAQLKASISGSYIQAGAQFQPLYDQNRMQSFLAKASTHFPEVSTLILGNGMGVSVDHEAGIIDIPVTGGQLEGLKDMYPELKLWLEPGRHIVSHAGVLLVRVIETREYENIHYVRINMEMSPSIKDDLHGIHHKIVDLSRIDEEIPVLSRINGQEKTPGDTIGYVRGPAPVKKGDILLFTNMGACGPERRFDSEERSLGEHYLAARRICQVKI